MAKNSFSMYASARNVAQQLRARIQAAPDGAAELYAALDQIETLWGELHKQADLLAEERQRFADFFEFAPDAYVITDPHGALREANREARELLRVAEESLGTLSLAGFVPEPERPAFRGRLVAVRGRPEGEAEEWRGSLEAPGRPPLPVVYRVRPIKVRRKNAEGLCWLIRPAD